MGKRKGWIVGPAAVGLLLLAGCQNIPYYDESLGWFSWSEYDPEVKAIEAQTPPPGALEAPAADDRAAMVRDGRGGYVHAEPPPGVVVALGATPLASDSAAGTATASLADASGGSAASMAAPLVGIRSSVGPSVTWRSARGTP